MDALREPTFQELFDRARDFEQECVARYNRNTRLADKEYDVLGMSDAIGEQLFLMEEAKRLGFPLNTGT
jgi:hypothetical protein